MNQVLNLFKNAKEFCPKVLTHSVPFLIFEEIEKITKATLKLKNHPFNFLLNHVNAGKNTYQVSAPFSLIDGSFLHAYLIYLGQYYFFKYHGASFERSRRVVRLRKNNNHFDHYDLWVNYAQKGASNPPHVHQADLSGVIYYTDCKNNPTILKKEYKFYGQKKDILIFPSDFLHEVKSSTTKKVRITLAFNLYLTQPL
jgi:hypothetical protein